MAKSPYYDKPHARIYAEWLHLPAWRALSCFGKTLLVEMMAAYRPTGENRIELSDRRIASILNCSRQTAARAIAQLEECGWLEVERVGKMTGPRSKRSSAYSLSIFARITGEAPTKAFLRWRKPITNGLKYDQQRPTLGSSTAYIAATSESRPSNESMSNPLTVSTKFGDIVYGLKGID